MVGFVLEGSGQSWDMSSELTGMCPMVLCGFYRIFAFVRSC